MIIIIIINSGLCACTFHFFYNSPLLLWLVSLQALTTVIGNSTMALAAYRIYEYEKNKKNDNDNTKIKQIPLEQSDKEFATDLLVNTAVAAFIVKYGELFVDFPFNPTTSAAALMIGGGTLFVSLKWYNRSKDSNSNSNTISISSNTNDVGTSGQWP